MVQIYIGKGVLCHRYLFSSHFHGNMLAWTSVATGRAAWQDLVDCLQEELLAIAHRNVAWSHAVWRDQVTWSVRITALDISCQKQQLGQTFDSQLSPSLATLPHPIAPSSPAEKTVYTTGYNF